VLLVTDGFPTECQPQQISDIVTIAKTAFETDPKVRTFVVGFNLGAAGTNLDQIAQAGGTGTAALINGGDISGQFVTAGLATASVLDTCKLDLPKSAPGAPPIDPARVGVILTPSTTGVPQQVPKLNTLADCALNQDQGWYYDSPAVPTQILLCPGTCANEGSGQISVQYGCSPLIGNTN
jgi:hypothetical protein